MSRRYARHAAAVVGLVTAAAVTAACSTLPTETEPQVLRTFDSSQKTTDNKGPERDQEPDLLVRGFYSASAQQAGDYSAARSYLTSDASNAWKPEDKTFILDHIEITAAPGGSDQARSFKVRGTMVGQLSKGGSFVPDSRGYDATVELKKVDGQWRISNLPGEIVFERADLYNNYKANNLYFFEQTGKKLVADRRWIYNQIDGLDTALISTMMDGPSDILAPGVRSAAPKGARFNGRKDGVYSFSGFQNADEQTRLQFAAQLAWTLSTASIQMPYKVSIDGAPVAPNYDQITTDDFADMNPRSPVKSVGPMYALSDGKLAELNSSSSSAVPGPVGQMTNIASADITEDRNAAVVQRDPGTKKSRLFGGRLDSPLTQVFEADSITRPSFSSESNSAWMVKNGRTIVRVVRSGNSGQFVENEVESSSLADIQGNISELQLSPTGVRVAMIINGSVYIGVATNPGDGPKRLVNVHKVANEIQGSALSLEWQPDRSLIVGTANPDAPVWRVEQDGSAVKPMPNGNLAAPVVAVAASPTTIYATDELAIRQLPVSGSTSTWRDVPGLQGTRAAPIVPN